MFCTFAGALLLGVAAHAQSYAIVALAWNPSPSSDVAGYDIYYGTSSGNYTMEVPVSPSSVTNLTIYGLTSGQTYYFAATAFDGEGNQGPFSPEISMTAGSSSAPQGAAGTLSTVAKLPAGQFGFTMAGTTDAQYLVQASTDLVHWVTLQTNSAPFTFVDSNASHFNRRFYRTVSN
jgi:hypothetical protein